MQHLLRIEQLTRQDCLALLTHAQAYLKPNEVALASEYQAVLKGKQVVTMFFEPSTRTRMSFAMAVHHLGGHVMDLNAMSSSVQKGETITDTALNLNAMGFDGFIIRHPEPGLPGRVAKALPQGHVINAGDGCHQHPSQALLDALTIQRHGKSFESLSVAIVGDVLHSRVARSEVELLTLLGVPDIRLVVPPAVSPSAPWPNTRLVHKVIPGIQDVDVIIALRGQVERMSSSILSQFRQQSPKFVIDQVNLAYAKPDVLVMHSGPITVGDELAHDVLKDPRCVALEQVTYGVAMRMAILSQWLTKPPTLSEKH